MADECPNNYVDNNVDYHVNALFEHINAMKKNPLRIVLCNRMSLIQQKRSINSEVRSLEFWRSIASECLASFFYVFIVCGAATGAGVGASVSSVLLSTALASGLTMATLTQCFLHISGAHINPAVSFACCAIKLISPIRAAMYITAQCGGGIAGAALLYGVTIPGYQGNLHASVSQGTAMPAWEQFGVEFILTFIVVMSYLMATESFKKIGGNSPIFIGTAYSACSFVSMPILNPARSLGPSFVLNKWENHWAYWCGTLFGGLTSGMIYEYFFKTSCSVQHKLGTNEHNISIHSDNDMNYDLSTDKPVKFLANCHNSNVNESGPSGNVNLKQDKSNFCENLYSTSLITNKYEQEPLYGGTRSMYCRSPTLTRSNLNRSHSVYAKTNTIINRDITPHPGPLVPAQSLLPLRPIQTDQSQTSHVENQNVQNLLQQKSENAYGVRTSQRQSKQSQQTQHQTQQQKPPQQQQQPPQHPQPTQQQHPLQQQQQQPNQQPQQYHQQQQQIHQQERQVLQQQPHQQHDHQHNHQHFRQQYSNQNDSHAGFYATYGVRQYATNEDNSKFHRRSEAIYGIGNNRNRGHSAQSDDSSYGSYNGTVNVPSARTQNINDPTVLLYVPQTSSLIPESLTSQRTQSERKVTAPVLVSQPLSIISKNSNNKFTSKTDVTMMLSSTQQNQRHCQQQQQQQQLHHQQQLNQPQQNVLQENLPTESPQQLYPLQH